MVGRSMTTDGQTQVADKNTSWTACYFKGGESKGAFHSSAILLSPAPLPAGSLPHGQHTPLPTPGWIGWACCFGQVSSGVSTVRASPWPEATAVAPPVSSFLCLAFSQTWLWSRWKSLIPRRKVEVSGPQRTWQQVRWSSLSPALQPWSLTGKDTHITMESQTD